MRALTQHEKRTVRIAAAGLALYLVFFFGARVWKSFDLGRREYVQLVQEARGMRDRLQMYQDKAEGLQTLMDGFRMDPAKLDRATVVAEASAAIQKAATSERIQLGPIHESGSRGSQKELSQVQLEGTGPLAAVLGFLSQLDSIGYPLIVDSVQINSDPRPGNVKVTLTIVILDYEQWNKKEQPPHA
jgi:hypothetical protein